MPVTQVEPPPLTAASFGPFHVSEPGSPLPGIVKVRQTSFSVLRSVAAIQPRMPYSAPPTPLIAMSFTIRGAPVMVSLLSGSATWRCHATWPVSLLVAMRRPSRVWLTTKSPQSATPRLFTPQQATAPAHSLSVLGSIFQRSFPSPPRVSIL